MEIFVLTLAVVLLVPLLFVGIGVGWYVATQWSFEFVWRWNYWSWPQFYRNDYKRDDASSIYRWHFYIGPLEIRRWRR